MHFIYERTIQNDIVRTRNLIRKFLRFHGIAYPIADKDIWGRKEHRALAQLPLSEPLRISLDALLAQLEQLWTHSRNLRASLRQLSRKERYRNAFEIAKSVPASDGSLPSGWS